jgi:lipopolysaccharide transport protein LptA
MMRRLAHGLAVSAVLALAAPVAAQQATTTIGNPIQGLGLSPTLQLIIHADSILYCSEQAEIGAPGNPCTVPDLAILEGNVQVRQGTLTIRADRMRLFYGQAPAAPGPDSPLQAQRIEAEGNLLMVSQPDPDDPERTVTASGATAVFDAPSNTVIVIGDPDVLLTMGPNVIRGPALHIDIGLGTFTIEASGGSRPQLLIDPGSFLAGDPT